jgi:hypothetical protein
MTYETIHAPEEKKRVLIADEQSNLPDNLDKAIKHKRFHCSDKGCKVEMRCYVYRSNNQRKGGSIIVKYCHTHDTLCSKTGWEVGYYGGTKTKDLKSINAWGNLCKFQTGTRVVDLDKDYKLVDSKIFEKK